MSSASVALRTLVAFPRALLVGTHTKLSVVMAAYLGIFAGAHSRAAGTTPAPVLDEVRDEIFTDGGRIAESETPPPSPIHEWASEQVGPWITEPLVTTPESWNTGVEQVVIVPMLQAILSLMEVTAGVGYWLAAYVPPQVISIGGVVIVGAAIVAHLLSLREVAA